MFIYFYYIRQYIITSLLYKGEYFSLYELIYIDNVYFLLYKKVYNKNVFLVTHNKNGCHYIRKYIMTTNILLYTFLYNEKYTFMCNKIFDVIIHHLV